LFAGEAKMLGSAEGFVDVRFKRMKGVLGVLLMGSAALGCEDELSDIDLEVVATPELYRRVEKLCGSEKYGGMDVWWEWITFDELEGELKDWEDDMNLWVYSKSKILLDTEQRIEKLLANYRHYPKPIWLEKLFIYWYLATGNAPYDSGKAIQRGDLLTAQLYLSQAMEYYAALIFILNNTFVPYRKWRLKELNKLSYKPKNYEENLRKILTVKTWATKELETKQYIVNRLVRNLEKKLLEAGVQEEKLKNPWRFKIAYTPRV
jgi:predicted nucleotidyltransferase